MTENDQTPLPVDPQQAPTPPPLPGPDWQAAPAPASAETPAASAPSTEQSLPVPASSGVPPVAPTTPLPPSAGSPSPHSGRAVTVIIAAVLALVLGAFAGIAGGFLGVKLATDGSGAPLSLTKVRVVPSETSEPVVAAAAAAVPSVVNIEVRGGTTTSQDGGLPQDHPDVPVSGNGSGVAYKRADDGGTYVITNNHVVADAQRITVRDASGKSVAAELMGADAETDIAVVKVDTELPLIETADSADLLVGQTTVAIGSPYGLEHSVSSGIVSALGRSLPDYTDTSESTYPLVDVIQTDAAINPGNSGGALVDASGKLIGINTAIYSDSGSSGGIGFAIPSNTAMRVADQIISGDEITHPFIGVVGQSVTSELAAQEKLPVTEGAYVVEITPGTGADEAGVQVGDVVTEVDGEPTRSMDDLILQIRRKQVGQDAQLTIVRGDETLTLAVKVGDKPEDLQTSESEIETPVVPQQ